MATSTMMATPVQLARPPTPKVASSIRILTKRASFQSLNSPTLLSPVEGRQLLPSVESNFQDSPGWEHINIISPSTASHHSSSSDIEEAFRSPRLALLTSNLSGTHAQPESPALQMLISPSEPVQLPGDELLYNPATEQRPDVPFFDVDLQTALRATKQEMKDISLAIWGCPTSHRLGSDLHALKQWAQQLSEFEPSRTRTVGLVGDPGVGKSSVINSLLDQPYLAHSGIADKRLTTVITEYRFRPAHYDEPFGIEVDYMTTEEIKELIQELLRSFRAYHIPAFQAIEDVEERRDIETQSEEAWRTLHSMFQDQAIFTKEFVIEHAADANTPLLNILERWALKFLTNRPGGAYRTWSSTAFDLDECRDKLEVFTSDPIDKNTAALWPFVRVVRVYLRSSLLQSGLVLVDCPSPRNLNFHRRRATERYLRNCHEVFAVTDIESVLSDKSVADIIRRNGRHRPLRIICTRSDSIDPRAVERGQPDISLQVRALRQQIDSLHRQVKRAEAHRRKGVPFAMEDEACSRDMLEDMEHALKKFLIERRNQHVMNRILTRYSPEVQVGELKVFCVSNTDYLKHRYDEQKRAESRLELSGIVGLRRYCHAIPAEGQLDAACAFIEYEVPAFLGSLKQWALGAIVDADANKAEDIRQLMQSLEDVAIKKLVLPTAQIQMTRSALNQQFAISVLSPIRDQRSEWRTAALEASKEWSKWSTKDYSAYCRHHGNHSSPTTGLRSWNEELISPMRIRIETNWAGFQDSVEKRKRELIDAVEADFSSICEPLRSHLPSVPIENVLATMPARISTILHTIHIGFTDLQEGTQQIESDTLFGHTSSYINTLMAPAYHAASILPTESPPSSPTSATMMRDMSPTMLDARRKLLVTTHIASARIFPRLAAMVERSHRGFVRVVFDGMVEAITREVDALIRDLHCVVPSTMVEVDSGTSDGGGDRAKVMTRQKGEAEQFPEFAARLKARIAAAEAVMAEARDVVEDVRSSEDQVDEDKGALACEPWTAVPAML